MCLLAIVHVLEFVHGSRSRYILRIRISQKCLSHLSCSWKKKDLKGQETTFTLETLMPFGCNESWTNITQMQRLQDLKLKKSWKFLRVQRMSENLRTKWCYFSDMTSSHLSGCYAKIRTWCCTVHCLRQHRVLRIRRRSRRRWVLILI